MAASRKRAKQARPAQQAQPAHQGAATIVYVHGIGNKPQPSVLKAQWDQALFQFDLGERSRMAYWVDRERYPEPMLATAADADFADDSDDPAPIEFSAKATRTPWDPAAERSELQSELGELTGTATGAKPTPVQQKRLASLGAKLLTRSPMADESTYRSKVAELEGSAGTEARRIQAQRIAASGVRAKVLSFLPRPWRQWLTRRLTRAFLRDVNDLFVDREKGERMRQRLRDRLRAGGGPFVVVSHSQGSMIAYSVLMEPEFAELDVRLFMTLGSPLGIDEVQDFIRDLTKTKGKLRVPPCVGRWVNVCDPLDPVALDKSLAGEFTANARKVRVEDHLLFNPDSPRHPHSATGYLALGPVRQPVRDCVNTALFQPVADFKLAKDVVRALSDARTNERHRVLVHLHDFSVAQVEPDIPVQQLRRLAIDRIYAALEAADPKSPQRQSLQPEELHRYVALSLTRGEAESLGAIAHGDVSFPVARIWKNSAKRALLDYSIHTTQAFPAHNSYQAAGDGINWAVLDSGVHVTHPHFGGEGGSIAAVYDCTRTANRQGQLRALDLDKAAGRKDAHDFFGHGAHVAGIIAGRHVARDKKGADRNMCSMAPAAKLHIYKVLDDTGGGEDSWIIKALDHIFETNERAGRLLIHGVNLSLGGPFDVEAFNCGHTPLCTELRRLWRQGVVVVVAAGNEGFAALSSIDGEEVRANMGMSLGDPANLEEGIVVGSVHKDSPHSYGLSYFSSRGPTADGRMKPDCVAPGERIYSVRNDAPADGSRAGFEQLYTEMSGTSMAAPHVSGLVASFLSKRREFIGRPDEVKRILLDNCTDLGRQRHMQGAGMPNLVKMLVNV